MDELSTSMFLAAVFFFGLGVLFAMANVSVAAFFLGGGVGCSLMALVLSFFDE